MAEAERRVVEAERHVANQREFVARLDRDGRDPSQALQLLQQFEELQSVYMADRDRLRMELGL